MRTACLSRASAALRPLADRPAPPRPLHPQTHADPPASCARRGCLSLCGDTSLMTAVRRADALRLRAWRRRVRRTVGISEMRVEFCARVCLRISSPRGVGAQGAGGGRGAAAPPRSAAQRRAAHAWRPRLRSGLRGLSRAVSGDSTFHCDAALPDDPALWGHDSNDNRGTALDSKPFSATRTHGGEGGPLWPHGAAHGDRADSLWFYSTPRIPGVPRAPRTPGPSGHGERNAETREGRLPRARFRASPRLRLDLHSLEAELDLRV